MRTFSPSRALVGLGLSGLVVLSLTPTAAFAAASPTATHGIETSAVAGGCTVTAADVRWGFKESFRSYISGSIAKGAWEVQGGAGYETPNFSWTGGTGWYDPSTQTGEVAFTGGIHFTGHNGLLDTTVQNPTLVMTGPGTAQVLIDISGVSMEDALAGSTAAATLSDVPLVDVDLTAATTEQTDDSLTITAAAAPTTITAEGFAAFGNYETGTPFDPIDITLTADCPVDEPTPSPSPTSTVTVVLEAEETASTGVNWAIFAAIGAALVAVLGGTTAALAMRRRRATTHASRADGTDASRADGTEK